MRKIKKDDNFLSLVPVKNPNQEWRLESSDKVQIIIPRMSLMDRLVRLVKKTPETMVIDLDSIGSFVWNAIDDVKDIGTIAEELHDAFGTEVEPIYERLGLYINILRNNKWITLN